MLIPIGDDNPCQRRPIVNWTLLGLNISLFFLLSFRSDYQHIVNEYGYIADQFPDWTILTSMFLHGGLLHLFGNMLFLWIFGDNVEDRLGRFSYLFFYLVGGVIAGFFHFLMVGQAARGIAAIGASGAISAVLGAYMVFFPWNEIEIWYFFYYSTGTTHIASFWGIGLWFVGQLLSHYLEADVSSIAYGAHIGGFIGGGLIALPIKWFEASGKAPLTLKAQQRQRLTMAGSASASLPSRWLEEEALSPGSETQSQKATSPRKDWAMKIRMALESSQPEKALPYYEKWQENRMWQEGPLEPDLLLAIGNEYQRLGQPYLALEAYHQLITQHPRSYEVSQACLQAGLLYARQPQSYHQARAMLQEALATETVLLETPQLHEAEETLKFVETELNRITAGASATSSGRCTIIRQASEGMNISEVGSLIAGYTGYPLADVTNLIRDSKGLLAFSIPADIAYRLADELQQRGHPVLVIPDEDLVALPPARELRPHHISITYNGLVFQEEGEHAGKTHTVSWSQVFLITAGRLLKPHQQVSQPLESVEYIDDVRLVTSTLKMPSDLPHEEDYYYVIDIFLLEPWRRVRLKEDYHSGISLQRIRQVACQLLQWGGSAPLAPGVRRLGTRAGDTGSWSALSFDAERDFEQYNFWLVQLESWSQRLKTHPAPEKPV